MSANHVDPQNPVRLTVVQLDQPQAANSAGILHQVDTTTGSLVTVASAVVREFADKRLQTVIGAIERTFGAEPSPAGFAAVINKPTAIMLLAVWPWATDDRMQQFRPPRR